MPLTTLEAEAQANLAYRLEQVQTENAKLRKMINQMLEEDRSRGCITCNTMHEALALIGEA